MDAEKELKRAIKSGDGTKIAKAFERFYQENVRLVYRVLIDVFGKDDETDDDVQESFLGLLKDPKRLLAVDHIADYWIKSAQHICGHRRKRAKRIESMSEGNDVPDQRQSVSSLVREKALLENIIAWLGHPDADIVIWQAAYGYSQKEIAERLGMGEDAVCYRYRKAVKELRRRLKDEKE